MKESDPSLSSAPESDEDSHDDLLVELSLLRGDVSGDPAPVDPPPLHDRQLRAYRDGALEDEAATAVERRLSQDPAARARLAELAGQPLPGPSPFLRERVLRAYRKERPSRPLRRWAPWTVAALLVLSLSGLLWRSGPEPLPSGLRYDVTAEGLAEVRSSGTARASGVKARADTVLTFTLAPEGEAVADIEPAVYLPEGGGWRRLERGLDISLSRGVAVLSVPASLLAGEHSGETEVRLVVGRAGDLPVRLDAAELEAPGDRWRVYRVGVTWVP